MQQIGGCVSVLDTDATTQSGRAAGWAMIAKWQSAPESSRDKTQMYYLTTRPEGGRKATRFQSRLNGRDLEVCTPAAGVRSLTTLQTVYR